jgi:hypothetical protein
VTSPAYASPNEVAQYRAAEDFSWEQLIGPTMSGPVMRDDLAALGIDFKNANLYDSRSRRSDCPAEAGQSLFRQYQGAAQAILPGAGNGP